MKVTGTIYDEEKQPLPGVGVLVAGSTNGVVSDNDGRYAITVKKGQELNYSCLGFKTETMVVGKSSVINVVMHTDAQIMETAIVTALGLEREEKSLGYAASKIEGEAFANAAASDNWLSSLAGEVAGLDISLNNGGTSSRVTLRGEASTDFATNTALFVIDGVPMFNTATTSDDGSGGDEFFIDFGDGTADINPNDIESVTVLKGPAATALYGSSASNGAILITTKSANKQKTKFSVNFASSASFQSVNSSPDLQYIYGQGTTPDYFYVSGYEDSVLNPGSTMSSQNGWNAFGPKMDGTPYYQYFNAEKGIGGTYDENGKFTRVKTPFVNHGDWFKNFFETGYILNNTLTVSGRINKDNAVRISFTDKRGMDITPGSDYSGQTLSLKMNNQFTEWFTSEVSLNYRRNFHDSIPTSTGFGSTSVMYSLWTYSPSIDMEWAKNYWKPGEEGITQETRLTGKNNVHFVINECVNSQDKDRIYGNVKLDFKLYKGLTLMVRGGLDSTNDFRTSRIGKSAQGRPKGYLREQDVRSLQYSGDFLFRYQRRLPSDFHLTASFGGSINYQEYSTHTRIADNLVEPGVYTLTNTATEIRVTSTAWQRQTNSLYGLVNLAWRNSLFLDLTGRNDWASTLPEANRSFFYPSVSASAVLNELFNFGYANGRINLMKLRVSWANVGRSTSPNRTIQTYVASDQHGSIKHPSQKRNGSLRPEMVNSFETGLDLKMFKRRLSLDIAYYNSITKDVLSQMPVSKATGMTYLYFNAGKIQNWGIEIAASGTILKKRGVELKLNANWSFNRNKVLELAENIDNWQLAYYSNSYMYAAEGQSLTAMYGTKYKRAPEGSYATDAAGNVVDVSGQLVLNRDGSPLVDDDIVYIGETAPKWKGGFGFNLSWKTLKLSARFDGKYGGNVMSLTTWVMNSRGKGIATLPGREGELKPDGVVEMDNGGYRIFDENIDPSNLVTYYSHKYRRECTESIFVSNQYLRLREVRLEYSLPKKVMKRIKYLNNVSFAVFGNNLYTWSDFPGFDPTAVSMRGNALSPGFELLQMPGTAQYGASVRLTY